MEHARPAEAAAHAIDAAATQARVGRRILQKHGVRLAIAFALIAAALWTFGELAEDVAKGEPFWFDAPLLQGLHALAGPTLDAVFLGLSAVGYGHGVVPFDIALVVYLAWRHHPRTATFAALGLGGSALINVAAKHVFQRARPMLWASIAPESTYSFPSGHAMGSATLVCVLACLAWRTCWRWPVIVAGVAFALGIGASRVYLGVHYPSDVLAGWAAAIAWVLGVRFIAFHRGLMTGSTRV